MMVADRRRRTLLPMPNQPASRAGTELRERIEAAVAARRAAGTEQEYEAAWVAAEAMRRFGVASFEAGIRLLDSADPAERAVGCAILGQLCNPDESGWSPQVAAAVAAIGPGETEDAVCWSIARALGLAGDPLGVAVLAGLATHPDAGVRFQVACALPGCASGGDPTAAVAALLALMDDEDEDVRDWATFGLGSNLDVDDQQVRDALFRRSQDPHLDTRDEAIVGLARRRDRRALELVMARLNENEVGRLAVEAAAYLADARLLPILTDLATWWDVDPALVAEAIDACDPQRRRLRAGVMERLYGLLSETLASSMPGATATLACRRREQDVELSIEAGDRTAWYAIDGLISVRAGGDVQRAVAQVLSDLEECSTS